MADPTKRIHRKEVIRLAELAGDEARIEDRVFEDCQILGPAIIVPQESGFFDSTWTAGGGSVEAILWEVPPHRRLIVGAILVRLCEFRKCRFQGIGIAGPSAAIAEWRTNLGLPNPR